MGSRTVDPIRRTSSERLDSKTVDTAEIGRIVGHDGLVVDHSRRRHDRIRESEVGFRIAGEMLPSSAPGRRAMFPSNGAINQLSFRSRAESSGYLLDTQSV